MKGSTHHKEFTKNGGRYFDNIFSTVCQNDANDMALESYGVGATFFYIEFSLIPEGIRADFKLLFAVCSHGQRTFTGSELSCLVRLNFLLPSFELS